MILNVASTRDYPSILRFYHDIIMSRDTITCHTGMYKPISYCEEGHYTRAVKSGTLKVYLDIPTPHTAQFIATSAISGL